MEKENEIDFGSLFGMNSNYVVSKKMLMVLGPIQTMILEVIMEMKKGDGDIELGPKKEHLCLILGIDEKILLNGVKSLIENGYLTMRRTEDLRRFYNIDWDRVDSIYYKKN